MASLTKTQVMIMAATAGIAVANVYYSQPILGAIAQSFHITAEKAGSMSVLSQVGYGIGLFFLTPVGDMIERKKLILYLQGGLIAALLLIAFAPNVYVLFAGSLLIGVFSVVAQVILPMAASLVKENRGKVVGQIFTGLLVGILVARVFSGFITNWLGWHYVYMLSAGLVLGTAVLMQADFPSTPERFSGTYAGLLKSTVAQLGRFSLLRRAALTGMLAFGTLSAFWVTLTFYLSDAPFHYSPSQIGLFGLLAAAGALIAPVFGKLADKGTPHRSLLFSTGITLVSILVLKLAPGLVAAIWVTVILMDIGVQATQVTNIALIYSLDHTANSRINTVYMTSYFIGGAVGSFAAIQVYHAGGWPWATTLMVLLSVAALMNAFTLQPKNNIASI
ncbi:Predicted arabinose efflux permease, MFS family [Filimonas lacunae]|uniref:Predicted arabinose efflux permease, MFS family n=1 Tax=Filimonas lacunae TaxID=477680 RepID=A0A173MI69_9BACT|nr:MFS transporter [Filimonas lacunae]BAV07314.1 permeases of the major facilitator superfamily [Filimonas lacunae]SIS91520.1 Predicted arabinose efflux permease, MFS family [Filimonas lacunae]